MRYSGKFKERNADPRDDVAQGLGGLPERKMHRSNLGACALRLAIAGFGGGG